MTQTSVSPAAALAEMLADDGLATVGYLAVSPITPSKVNTTYDVFTSVGVI